MGAVRIQVKLFSTFRALVPREARGQTTLELPDGAALRTVLTALGISEPIKLITVNDRRESNPERVLADGDVVHLFPPVVGG